MSQSFLFNFKFILFQVMKVFLWVIHTQLQTLYVQRDCLLNLFSFCLQVRHSLRTSATLRSASRVHHVLNSRACWRPALMPTMQCVSATMGSSSAKCRAAVRPARCVLWARVCSRAVILTVTRCARSAWMTRFQIRRPPLTPACPAPSAISLRWSWRAARLSAMLSAKVGELRLNIK